MNFIDKLDKILEDVNPFDDTEDETHGQVWRRYNIGLYNRAAKLAREAGSIEFGASTIWKGPLNSTRRILSVSYGSIVILNKELDKLEYNHEDRRIISCTTIAPLLHLSYYLHHLTQ